MEDNIKIIGEKHDDEWCIVNLDDCSSPLRFADDELAGVVSDNDGSIELIEGFFDVDINFNHNLENHNGKIDDDFVDSSSMDPDDDFICSSSSVDTDDDFVNTISVDLDDDFVKLNDGVINLADNLNTDLDNYNKDDSNGKSDENSIVYLPTNLSDDDFDKVSKVIIDDYDNTVEGELLHTDNISYIDTCTNGTDGCSTSISEQLQLDERNSADDYEIETRKLITEEDHCEGALDKNVSDIQQSEGTAGTAGKDLSNNDCVRPVHCCDPEVLEDALLEWEPPQKYQYRYLRQVDYLSDYFTSYSGRRKNDDYGSRLRKKQRLRWC